MELEDYKKVLGEYLKPKQVSKLLELLVEYEEIDQIFYETVGQLSTGIKYETILDDLMSDKTMFDSTIYKDLKFQRELKDKSIEHPPELKEGEIDCSKCKQKKTIIVEFQSRSCDEGFTYEIHCYNKDCKFIKRTTNF